jgi:MerR family transcriptional activator of bmr gene
VEVCREGIDETLMGNDQYFSIGQVSKLCNISIQTLRYYDKINLVKPYDIDKHTGYRSYSNLNVLHIRIIQDMKNINFSLEEISHALKFHGLNDLALIMKAKQKETLGEIQRLQGISSSIEQRIKQMNDLQVIGSGFKDLDILIEFKHLPDRFVAFDRRPSPCSFEAFSLRFAELLRKITTDERVPNGYLMAVFHESILTFDPADSDLEICIPIARDCDDPPLVREIKGGPYITAVYSGIPNHDSCKQVYGKLHNWMKRNGYSECGPSVEQYMVDMAQMMHPEEYIVELQIPVKAN